MRYRVTVTSIPPIIEPLPGVTEQEKSVDTYSQTFDESEFDMQTLVLALNRKRRVRKARGKETT